MVMPSNEQIRFDYSTLNWETSPWNPGVDRGKR